MLELKHVSYSYQSYLKRSSSDVKSIVQNGLFTALSVSLEQENQPSSPLGWSRQSQEGAGLFGWGGHSRPKASYHCKHHVSLVFQNYNLIDYLITGKCPFGQQTSQGKEILDWDWTKRKSNAMSCNHPEGNSGWP